MFGLRPGAVVTGAGPGIGAAIAAHLCPAGAAFVTGQAHPIDGGALVA